MFLFITLKWLVVIGGILSLPIVMYFLLNNSRITRLRFACLFAGYYCIYLFLAGVLTAQLAPQKLVIYNATIQIVNFIVSVPIIYLLHPAFLYLLSKRSTKK